ncbi:MAG: class I SAM-dependent methyltransferase [Syntrophomonadaceae bacterium]|nr:class I SAM-dependent methyltransferase [Syntrophomonadaceae bacterium]
MSFLPNGVVEKRHSDNDRKSYEMIEKAFQASDLSVLEKLDAFPRFISKRSLTHFLCRYEIYKKILNVNGVIIECGVLNGAGLFTWAQLSNIFEPVNYNRRIIGFDTFEGFPSVSENDVNTEKNPGVGDLHGDSIENILVSVEKHNLERLLSHIPTIELVKGDFNLTGEPFLERNKQLLISMLYLDFDLYEPTKKALEVFFPRMAKGSIICFDELNCTQFPGETVALLECLDIKKYAIERFPMHPWISYIQL